MPNTLTCPLSSKEYEKIICQQMICLKGCFEWSGFLLNLSHRQEHLWFSSNGKSPVSLSGLIQVLVGMWDLPRELVHILSCKQDALLIVNRECHKHELKVSRYCAHLSSSSGVSWTCHHCLWERKMSWVMDTNSFYHSHVLLACMWHNGKGDTIAKDDKKLYLWKHLLYLFGLRFFPCSQMQKSNSCVYALPAYVKAWPFQVCDCIIFVFLDSSRAEANAALLACSISVIDIKPCNSLLYSGEFASQ